MRPVVELVEVVPARLVEALDVHSGGFHFIEQRLVHFSAAQPIEQDLDLDAGARSLGQRVGEFLADRTRPVDVGLEIDRLARMPDRIEHRRKDLVAVHKDLEAVAVEDRRSEQDAHRAQELRVAHRVEVRELLLDALFAGRQVDEQQHRRQRCNDADDDRHDKGARGCVRAGVLEEAAVGRRHRDRRMAAGARLSHPPSRWRSASRSGAGREAR